MNQPAPTPAGAEPPPRPLPKWVAVAEIALILLVLIAASIPFAFLEKPEEYLLAAVVVPTAIAIAAATWRLRRQGIGWRALGLRRPRSGWEVIGLGFSALIVMQFLAVAVLEPLMRKTGIEPPDISIIVPQLEGRPLNTILWIVFVGWGSAGIGEELIMRGFVLDRLRILFSGMGEQAGWWIAATAQAVLFGLMHGYQGPGGILLVTLLAFGFALIYRWAGYNLWAPIVAHGLIDTGAMIATYYGIAPGA